MREILGLDPEREEDRKEFNMLIERGEIRSVKWGNGQVSEYLFDTDSILAYLQRERKIVEKELLKLTKTIEKMIEKMDENHKDLMVKLEEIKREREEADKLEY